MQVYYTKCECLSSHNIWKHFMRSQDVSSSAFWLSGPFFWYNGPSSPIVSDGIENCKIPGHFQLLFFGLLGPLFDPRPNLSPTPLNPIQRVPLRFTLYTGFTYGLWFTWCISPMLLHFLPVRQGFLSVSHSFLCSGMDSGVCGGTWCYQKSQSDERRPQKTLKKEFSPIQANRENILKEMNSEIELHVFTQEQASLPWLLLKARQRGRKVTRLDLI